ncbi:MAG: ARMT1-like domain-containing protein [Thermodesulfobacteriota bacterium]|nr:ARMT1-like domain-containing protein [Thermodesulfobacteriota bacterium]
MKTYLDCIPCFLRQALEASRMATEDEAVRRKVIESVMERLPRLSFDVSPPEIAQVVHGLIKEITGELDPYREIKKKHNEILLKLYSPLKETVKNSQDRLLTATKMAIAGNVIDLGVQNEIKNIEDSICRVLSSNLVIDYYREFKEALINSGFVLYLGDNAGEIVLDMILIEEIKRMKDIEIVFLVRGGPIINDVTMEDAKLVGMSDVVRVVSNGSDAPATILSQCSSEILELFSRTDMIVSKGQGNYESLSEEDRIFFLLKAKCPVVARELGVNIGDAILMGNSFREA